MVHLREVLELCCLHGLTIGLPKCGFEVSEVEFLGHNLTSTGCRPLIKHTSAIKKFPIPTDKPALQSFLVLENFYRKFIKDAALILASLTNALKGPDKLLVWSSTMESAFLHAKHLLSTVHPAPGSAVSVIKDASKSLLGAVLQQQMWGSWVPLSFYSRKLRGTLRYSLLQLHAEGRRFTLSTDHSLLLLFPRTSPPSSARQQRYLSYISSIVHLLGAENCIADALSWPTSSTSLPPQCKAAWTQTLSSSSGCVKTVSPAPGLTPVPGFSFD